MCLSNEELEKYAAQLGSDCPFFIANVPQIAGGRGEQLRPSMVDLSGFYIKLVNPGLHIGTAQAYAGVHFSTVKPYLSELLQMPIEEWRAVIHNDFERSVFQLYPEIAGIKNELYDEGALFALMSGSGSTVYGIFKGEPKCTFKHLTSYIEVIRQFPVTA